MDEYAREIRDLQLQVEQLVAAEEDPQTIADLEAQIDVLRALYERTQELLARGGEEPALRQALALRGYGAWTVDNVYAFVYEAAVEEPAAGPREFVHVIRNTDFAWLLEAPLRAS